MRQKEFWPADVTLYCGREKPPGKEDAVIRVSKTKVHMDMGVSPRLTTCGKRLPQRATLRRSSKSLRNSTFSIEELRKCTFSWKAVHLRKIRVLIAIISEDIYGTETPRDRLPLFP
jgi:hypothetical protein